MNNLWPDVREMLDKAAVQIEPTSFTLDGSALRTLLTDADALLAVARDNMKRAMNDWEGAARPSPGAAHGAVIADVGTFQEWLEVNEPALAALPERLQGKKAA